MAIVILKHELLFLSILKPIKAALKKAAFIGFIFRGGERIATGAVCPRNDIVFFKECDTSPGGSSGRPTPTDALQEVQENGPMWGAN